MKRNYLGLVLITLHTYSYASYIKEKLLRERNHIHFSYYQENDKIFFNLSAIGSRDSNIGIAFSFDDVPQHGILYQRDQGIIYLVNESGGMESGEFIMKHDKMVQSALSVLSSKYQDNDNKFFIEGVSTTSFLGCRGDVLKIFYMFGENLFQEKLLKFNWKKSSYGEAFITLDSKVQNEELEVLNNFKSFKINIDNTRPRPEGETICKTYQTPKSTKFLKGFVPVFTGYNGNNGLIRQISIHSCKTAKKRVVTAGKCEPDVSEICSQLIFLWTPGTQGEMFPEGSGLQISENDILVLKITYNAGTGWLYDSSGIKIYFTSIEQDYQIGKVVVTGENGIGICPGNCFKPHMSLVSVALLTNVTNTRMMLSSNNQIILQSGFTSQYQPLRHLPERIQFQDLQLNCFPVLSSQATCKAVVTYLSTKAPTDTTTTLCGTDLQKSTFCTTKENEKTNFGNMSSNQLEFCGASVLQEMKEKDASLLNPIVSDEQEKGDDVVTTLQMNKVNFQTMGIPQTTSQQIGNEKINVTAILSADDLQRDEEDFEISNSLDEGYIDVTDNPFTKLELEDENDLFSEETTESVQNNIDENTTGFLELDEFVGNSTRQSRLLAAGGPKKSSGEIMFQNIYRSKCHELQSSALLIIYVIIKCALL